MEELFTCAELETPFEGLNRSVGRHYDAFFSVVRDIIYGGTIHLC